MPALLPLYQHALPNSPGKSLVGLQVTFPPNGSTPPHRHAGAFVSVVVLSGSVLNKMNDDPMKIFHAGGTFHEMPGCHHKISDNASKTEEAMILATFVVDTKVLDRAGIAGLVEIDEEYRGKL
jgi:quercetin dioxygenase-like cupin family protein